MGKQSREQVTQLLKEFSEKVEQQQRTIRGLQDEVLFQVEPEHLNYAVTLMTAILARGGQIQVTNNQTTIGTAGVAITGGTSHGDITGNVQQNTSTDVASILKILGELRHELLKSPSLNQEQKDDSSLAIEDLEAEIQKPVGEQKPSRIRMAFRALTSTATLVEGAQKLYEALAPHLTNLGHLLK
jgi:hypothetical protein